MSDEIKRFSSPPPDEGAPIPFDVEGWREKTVTPPMDENGQVPPSHKINESEVHSFHAKRAVSGSLLLQVESMNAGGKVGKNARGGDAVMDFYLAALIEEDRERFRKLIDDPDFYVHAQTLQDIIVWLYGIYSARPTKRSNG